MKQPQSDRTGGDGLLEHATMCPECGETLFADETCESIQCGFSAAPPKPAPYAPEGTTKRRFIDDTHETAEWLRQTAPPKPEPPCPGCEGVGYLHYGDCKQPASDALREALEDARPFVEACVRWSWPRRPAEETLRKIDIALSAPVPSGEGTKQCPHGNPLSVWCPYCQPSPSPAVAAEPVAHYHRPSTLHMGDCSVCGNVREHPLHIGTRAHKDTK